MTIESPSIANLFTVSGIAEEIGVEEADVRRALAAGTIKHDVTAWRGWSVIALFYPSSVESIRAALRRKSPEAIRRKIKLTGSGPLSIPAYQ